MLKIKYAAIDDLQDLRNALLNAIRLEHSTIPPYLTAYYTLKNGAPQPGQLGSAYAREIIRDVVMEEMLHMALACNVLNAIGGTPEINRPDFIPKYPGPLPMIDVDSLTVGLRRYSRNLVEDVFMKIEEPEKPIFIPTATTLALKSKPSYDTIGEFYRAIQQKLREIPKDSFAKDHARQVTGWFGSELIEVTDIDSAVAAIETIVEQGEGTPERPLDMQNELAHFYNFEELVKGKRIVPDESSPMKFRFAGERIVIDDVGDVIDMVDDPSLRDFSGTPRAERLSKEFDYIYAKLLNALQAAFSGAPERMSDAVGVMFELKFAAEELLQVELGNGPDRGKRAGPKFLYRPMSE
jgi:hypothetical protein